MTRGKRVEIIKLTVDGVEIDAKACTKCGEVKALGSFAKAEHGPGSRSSSCLECKRKYDSDKRKQNNPSGVRRRRYRWTTASFRDHVHEATGGEYRCTGSYQDARTHTGILHITCGREWSVTPSHFISGRRCPHLLKAHKSTR